MGCDKAYAIEGLIVEITSITYFSVENVEMLGPRIDCVTKLTLNIKSRTTGNHSLVLVKPFPPFGRAGTQLARLRSLQRESIASILAFAPCADERSLRDARIEIATTAGESTIVRCETIEGLRDCVDLTQ